MYERKPPKSASRCNIEKHQLPQIKKGQPHMNMDRPRGFENQRHLFSNFNHLFF